MKGIHTFILLLYVAFASAQNINDGLRLNGESFLYGSLRFQGLNLVAFGPLWRGEFIISKYKSWQVLPFLTNSLYVPLRDKLQC